MITQAQFEILTAIGADWSLSDSAPPVLRHCIDEPRAVAGSDLHALSDAGLVRLRDGQWWPTAEGRIVVQQREGGR